MADRSYTIGTRGSPLALAQAKQVQSLLCAAHDVPQERFKIEVISTAGDRIQNRPLSEVGGKGLFSKEIETALSQGKIDLAVHSSKDMATVLPDGLHLSVFLERENVADAFISNNAKSLSELPQGAIVGSSSLRRQALIKQLRPDIDVVMFRGNVQTRLRKLEEGQVHATLLAIAGLNRLDMAHVATSLMDVDAFPPAPGQGAICIETRMDDAKTNQLVAPLNHDETEIALLCERAFLKALDGSCQTPIAGYAHINNGNVVFSGKVLSEDGTVEYATSRSGPLKDAIALGTSAGEELRERAGPGFFHHWT